jgi:hypothetical protein
MTSAEKLKTEGNALYERDDFASAILKYTKAIALESNDKRLNAILYANRSACQRGLKWFVHGTIELRALLILIATRGSYVESLSDAVKVSHRRGP